jgi:hypothetical protein
VLLYSDSYAILMTVIKYIKGFVLESDKGSSRYEGSIKDHHLSSIFCIISWSGYSILVVYRLDYVRFLVASRVVFGVNLWAYLSRGVLCLVIGGLAYLSDPSDSSFHS